MPETITCTRCDSLRILQFVLCVVCLSLAMALIHIPPDDTAWPWLVVVLVITFGGIGILCAIDIIATLAGDPISPLATLLLCGIAFLLFIASAIICFVLYAVDASGVTVLILGLLALLTGALFLISVMYTCGTVRDQQQRKVYPRVLQVANPHESRKSSRSTYSKRTPMNDSNSSLDEVIADGRGDRSEEARDRAASPQVIYVNPALEKRKPPTPRHTPYSPEPQPQHCLHYLDDYDSHTHVSYMHELTQTSNTHNETPPQHITKSIEFMKEEEIVHTRDGDYERTLETEHVITQTSQHSSTALVPKHSEHRTETAVQQALPRSRSRLEIERKMTETSVQPIRQSDDNMVEVVDVTVQTGDVYVRVASSRNVTATATPKSYKKPRMVGESMGSEVCRSDARDDWGGSPKSSKARTTTANEGTQTEEECFCMYEGITNGVKETEPAIKTPTTSCCGFKKNKANTQRSTAEIVKPHKGDCKMCTPECKCAIHLNPCDKQTPISGNASAHDTDQRLDTDIKTQPTLRKSLSTISQSRLSTHTGNTNEPQEERTREEEYICTETIHSEQDPSVSITKTTTKHSESKAYIRSNGGKSGEHSLATSPISAHSSTHVGLEANAQTPHGVKCPCHYHGTNTDKIVQPRNTANENVSKNVKIVKDKTVEKIECDETEDQNVVTKTSSKYHFESSADDAPTTMPSDLTASKHNDAAVDGKKIEPTESIIKHPGKTDNLTESRHRLVTKTVSFHTISEDQSDKSVERMESTKSIQESTIQLNDASSLKSQPSLVRAASSGAMIYPLPQPTSANESLNVNTQSTPVRCPCHYHDINNDRTASKVNTANEVPPRSDTRSKLKLQHTLELDEPAVNNAISRTVVRYHYDLIVDHEDPNSRESKNVNEPVQNANILALEQVKITDSNESLNRENKQNGVSQPEVDGKTPLEGGKSQEDSHDPTKSGTPQTPTAKCCGIKTFGKKQKNSKQDKQPESIDKNEESLKLLQPETESNLKESKSIEKTTEIQKTVTAKEQTLEGDETDTTKQSEGQCNCKNGQLQIPNCTCACPCCGPNETARSDVSDVPENWRKLELPKSATSKSSTSTRSQAPNLSTSCHGRHHHHGHEFDCDSSSRATTATSSSRHKSNRAPQSSHSTSTHPVAHVVFPANRHKSVDVVNTWANVLPQRTTVPKEHSMNNLLAAKSSVELVSSSLAEKSASTITTPSCTKDEIEVDDLLDELEQLQSGHSPKSSSGRIRVLERSSETTVVTTEIRKVPSAATGELSGNIENGVDNEKEAQLLENPTDDQENKKSKKSHSLEKRLKENWSKRLAGPKIPVRQTKASKTVKTTRIKDQFISSYGGVFPVGRDAAPMGHSPLDNIRRSSCRRAESPPCWQQRQPRQCYTTPCSASHNYDDIPVRGLVLPAPCQPVRPCYHYPSPRRGPCIPHDEIPVKGLPTTEYFFAPSARVCQRCGRVHDPGTPHSQVTVPVVCPNYHVHGTIDVNLTPGTSSQYTGRSMYQTRGLPPAESYNRCAPTPTPYVIPPDNTCAPIVSHETLRRRPLPPQSPLMPSPAVFVLGRANILQPSFGQQSFGPSDSTQPDCSCSKIREINDTDDDDNDDDDDDLFPCLNDNSALNRQFNNIAANMFGSMWRETETTERVETQRNTDSVDKYSRERRTPKTNRTVEREIHQSPQGTSLVVRELETTFDSFTSIDEEPSERDFANEQNRHEERKGQDERRYRQRSAVTYEELRLVQTSKPPSQTATRIDVEPFLVGAQMIPFNKAGKKQDQHSDTRKRNDNQRAGSSKSNPRRASTDKEERSHRWFT